MNNWIVSLFKALSLVMFCAMAVPPAIVVYGWGRMMDGYGQAYMVILGALIGAGLGILVATWALGLVHVMISIDDRLKKSVEVQMKLVSILQSGQMGFPLSPTNGEMGTLPNNTEIPVVVDDRWAHSSAEEIVDELRKHGFVAQRHSDHYMVTKGKLRRRAYAHLDLVNLARSAIPLEPKSKP